MTDRTTSDRPTMELLEQPAWVKLECGWLRGGLRKLRHVLRAPDSFQRHTRLVEVANEAAYLMRDHSLRKRPERSGGAEGGALLHLIVDGRLQEASDGEVTLGRLLDALAPRVSGGGESDDAADLYLEALAEVTPCSSIHDFAFEVLEESFPVPLDRFLHKELVRLGWALEHVPYETVTQAQAFADDPRERGGPDNLMNHLGRLVGWADAYPAWNFTVEGWEPIRFNGIPDGVVFKDTLTLVEIEGYPLPMGAGPAYGEARRKLLAGEELKVRLDEGGREAVVTSKIYPRRRTLLHPEGFLRVSADLDD